MTKKKKNPRKPLIPPNKRHKDKRKSEKYPTPREQHEMLDKITYEDGLYWPAKLE